MKTVIERVAGGPCSLDEFAERHGLTMCVTERPLGLWRDESARFYAAFADVEIKDGGMLKSSYGNGRTPEEAIANCAFTIRGQRLVFKAMREDRKEFYAPNEWSKS